MRDSKLGVSEISMLNPAKLVVDTLAHVDLIPDHVHDGASKSAGHCTLRMYTRAHVSTIRYDQDVTQRAGEVPGTASESAQATNSRISFLRFGSYIFEVAKALRTEL